MKIAITGTHGTAKSTLAKKEVENIRNEFPELSVEVLTEVVRDCPLPINRSATVDSQLWMFSTHLKREIEMENNYDVVISDRSLIDYVAYTKFIDIGCATRMLEMARHWMSTYSKIIVPSLETHDFLEYDGIRDVNNHEWRKAIQDEIIVILYELVEFGILDEDQFCIV